MNTIKNLHLISGLITAADIEKLEAGAKLHKRHAGIEFKILSVMDSEITIRTTQSKSFADNALSQADLVTRTCEVI